jgi:peptide/nickel transport system permease protein
MKAIRVAALAIASLLALISLGGSVLSRFDYAYQDRQNVATGASHEHWLGTDALGRDRFARLLEGTRVSLLLAPSAAAISTLLALAIGAFPGFAGGLYERGAKVLVDLMLSIPWLFLLLIVRALLPLNTSPTASAMITFLLLGLLGWAVPARILMARTHQLRQSDFLLLARSSGVSRWRLLLVHVLPNLWPVLLAQFWISVPVFILAEANLSLLGLGVAEPLPSLGSLLGEVETVLSVRSDIYCFASLFVLVLIVSSLQIAFSHREAS